MSNLEKPFKTIDEEIQILQSRGLIISDIESTQERLLNNNYYTVINGYKYPFLEKDENIHKEKFKNGASFDEIFALYEFDCQFRALLLKYILRVEHQLKSVISHIFAGKYRDIPHPDYLDKRYFDLDKSPKKREFYDDLRKHIDAELKHQFDNNNPMLTHYKENFNNIPPWILMSVLSFGMTRIFYCCLKNQDQNEIGRKFNLRPKEMMAYLSALNTYRNACAHDERIYNLQLRNKISRRDQQYTKVYVVILILKDMLDSATFMSFYSELNSYINSLSTSLKTINISNILFAMGMPVEPEVRKAELGVLESGNALSSQEFYDVLKHYILPILPFSSELLPIASTDSECVNPRCTQVQYKNERLYFAQNTLGSFSYYVSVPESSVINEQLEVIKEHLSTLIDFIHVFWNLSNLSIYGRDKVEIAFPNLCEQAYELTICSLMCNQKRKEAEIQYNKANAQYKREIGTALGDEQTKLNNNLKNLYHEYSQAVKDDAVAQQSLYKILTQIEAWANKTYEGQRKTFGIILCKDELPNLPPTFNYIDFLKSEYSATINDGLYSAVELYADGSFMSHISISHANTVDLQSIPYPFTGFADLCTQNKVGVLLTASGDILIINDRQLRYTKHNGFWLRCNSNEVINQLRAELGTENSEMISTIYQTITDLSYSRGGACIGIIDDDTISYDLCEMIKGGLLSVETPDEKRSAIKSMIRHSNGNRLKKFYELDRHLRRELLELDGAMVFSKSGLIHVIGTIIKLNGSGSDGGGRTAAAMQLSEYGLAIKISQDGYVQFFKSRKKILDILT